MMALPVLFTLNLHEAQAASEDDIITADLLTVAEPKSEAESRLRVIRLTTRGGATARWRTSIAWCSFTRPSLGCITPVESSVNPWMCR